MNVRQTVIRLCAYQANILEAIGDALRVLQKPAGSAESDMMIRRSKMLRLLREYETFKHNELFDPVIRSGVGTPVGLAQQLKINCIVTGESFHAYVQQWTARAAVEDWEGYLTAMGRMARTLEVHMYNERVGIEELLGMLKCREDGHLPGIVIAPPRPGDVEHGS